MSCQMTVHDSQTEFEFFQQLIQSYPSDCCGLLTTLEFTPQIYALLELTLTKMGMQGEYLDRYDPVMLDSFNLRLTMCPKHWIQHAQAIGSYALGIDRVELQRLALSIFRHTCTINNWDYKEILNYSKTVSMLNAED